VITNITRGGRRRRLLMGVVFLAAAVGLGAALVAVGAARGWRLALMVPLWGAGLGLFQARAGT
jgi:hypothetical protein